MYYGKKKKNWDELCSVKEDKIRGGIWSFSFPAIFDAEIASGRKLEWSEFYARMKRG